MNRPVFARRESEVGGRLTDGGHRHLLPGPLRHRRQRHQKEEGKPKESSCVLHRKIRLSLYIAT